VGHFAANTEMVVHETIDGETILIHMGTGTYYSIDGAGSDIWNLAATGQPEAVIAAQIAQRYGADRELVSTGVAELIAELVEEELLVHSADGATEAVELPDSAGGEFAPTALHKYTDMQEYMLVDPLHDVDVAAGWPHAASG
jgi:phosphopantothenoylcysteine synthetase/decarboxylase